jgi:hypothetical protein
VATNLSVTIDPATVLGVAPDASLHEIREAYRTKAKRYHPDAGGEEWAFRILVAAYESLSTARVTRATAREEAAPPRHAPQPQPHGFSDRATPPRPEPRPRPSADDGRETLRPGVQETATDPTRIVDVEKLTLRFQPEHIWLISEHGSENRMLSCSLNINWPDPKLATAPELIVNHESILRSFEAGFAQVAAETNADSSRSAVVDGRFSGWLSYPSSERAGEAFEKLSNMLHMVGLSVHQWTRDLLIPRNTREPHHGR